MRKWLTGVRRESRVFVGPIAYLLCFLLFKIRSGARRWLAVTVNCRTGDWIGFQTLPRAPAVGRVIMDHAKPDVRLPFYYNQDFFDTIRNAYWG